MDKDRLERFARLASALSPENLACDGELSRRQVAARHRRLTAEWKALEAEVGRAVTEEEVWREWQALSKYSGLAGRTRYAVSGGDETMKTMKEILAAVEQLLDGGDKVELDVNDKSVKDVVDELHRAKTRLELTQNGIAVDFPSGGSSTLRVYRIGAKAKALAPAAKQQEPEKQAATPVAAQVPKGRKGQHTTCLRP